MEKNTKLMYILAIFVSWISPLIFFLNAQSNEEKEEAKVSLNFEISYAIIVAILCVIASILATIVPMLYFVIMFVVFALWIWHLLINIKAMQASEAKQKPVFPFNFNLIK